MPISPKVEPTPAVHIYVRIHAASITDFHPEDRIELSEMQNTCDDIVF